MVKLSPNWLNNINLVTAPKKDLVIIKVLSVQIRNLDQQFYAIMHAKRVGNTSVSVSVLYLLMCKNYY